MQHSEWCYQQSPAQRQTNSSNLVEQYLSQLKDNLYGVWRNSMKSDCLVVD